MGDSDDKHGTYYAHARFPYGSEEGDIIFPIGFATGLWLTLCSLERLKDNHHYR